MEPHRPPPIAVAHDPQGRRASNAPPVIVATTSEDEVDSEDSGSRRNNGQQGATPTSQPGSQKSSERSSGGGGQGGGGNASHNDSGLISNNSQKYTAGGNRRRNNDGVAGGGLGAALSPLTPGLKTPITDPDSAESCAPAWAQAIFDHLIGNVFEPQDSHNIRVRKTIVIIGAALGLLQLLTCLVVLILRISWTGPGGLASHPGNIYNFVAAALTFPMYVLLTGPYIGLRYWGEASDALVSSVLTLQLASSTVECVVELWPSAPLVIAVWGAFAIAAQMDIKSLIFAFYSLLLIVYTTLNSLVNNELGFQKQSNSVGLSFVPRTVAMVVILFAVIHYFLRDFNGLVEELRRIGRKAGQTATAAVVIANDIAKYDTDAVHAALDDYERTRTCDRRVLKSFRRINTNLKRYRPFLPNYLFEVAEMDASINPGSPTNSLGASATPLGKNGTVTKVTTVDHHQRGAASRQSAWPDPSDPKSPKIAAVAPAGGKPHHPVSPDKRRARISEIMRETYFDDDNDDDDDTDEEDRMGHSNSLMSRSTAHPSRSHHHHHHARDKDSVGSTVQNIMGHLTAPSTDDGASTSTTDHATVNGLPSQSYWGSVTCCRVLLVARNTEASESALSIEDQYNTMVTRLQDLATATHASIHSFVGDTLCASWNGTRRVVQGELKACRFVLGVRRVMDQLRVLGNARNGVALNEAAFDFAAAVVTGTATCMFAGDERQRTFILSGEVFRDPLDAMFRKASRSVLERSGNSTCILCDHATNSVAKYRIATRGAIAHGMGTRTITSLPSWALTSSLVHGRETGNNGTTLAVNPSGSDVDPLSRRRASSFGRNLMAGGGAPTAASSQAAGAWQGHSNPAFTLTGMLSAAPHASTYSRPRAASTNATTDPTSTSAASASATPPKRQLSPNMLAPSVNGSSETLVSQNKEGQTSAVLVGNPPQQGLRNNSFLGPHVPSAAASSWEDWDIVFEILEERAECNDEWMYVLQATENAANEAVTDACALLLRGDVAAAKAKIVRVDEATKMAPLVAELIDLIAEEEAYAAARQQQPQDGGVALSSDGSSGHNALDDVVAVLPLPPLSQPLDLSGDRFNRSRSESPQTQQQQQGPASRGSPQRASMAFEKTGAFPE